MIALRRFLVAGIAALSVIWVPTAGMGQEQGVSELPSIAGAAIFIRNSTNAPIRFSLESANTDHGDFTIQPGESRTYSGSDNDTWFNVIVQSDGGRHVYGVDIGSRLYFGWVGNDLQLFSM